MSATPFDFGIAGRVALVCGSSQGLGKACAASLAQAGANVILNARSPQQLEQTAREFHQTYQTDVRFVAADITTAEGRATVLDVASAVDILVNNAGGPPPGSYEQWGEEEWHKALDAGMVAPIQLIRAVLPGMRARGWGRIINITSLAVKQPIPLLGLSTGARAGLTAFVSGLAREVAADGVTINNMLPGRFATDRLRSYAQALATRNGTSVEGEWHNMESVIPARRIGDPAEFGALCLFLASQQAAYVTAQNLLLDGGDFPGVF